VLAKGCRIDLHPRVFGPGRVAATMVAHVHALLHQTATDAFELTVASTLAAHAFDWLQSAAAEYGYEVI
jgi:sarcosine oxidase subunit gamma